MSITNHRYPSPRQAPVLAAPSAAVAAPPAAFPAAGLPGAALPVRGAFDPIRPQSAASPVNALGMGFLYLFIFLLVSRFCDIFLSGLRIPMLVSLVTLFFALATGQMRFAVTSRTALAMFGMTLWMMAGTPFSLWRGGTLEVLTEWLKSFIVFIVILAMVDTVTKAARVLQALAAAILCTGFLTLIAADSIAGRLILRQGLYSGPNELATACVIGLIAWWSVLGSNTISAPLRFLMVPFALFVAMLVPKTGSRAALVTMSVTMLCFLFRFKLITRVLVLLTAVGGIFVMILTLPSDIRLRYTSMFTDAEINTREEWQQMQYAQGSSEARWAVFLDSLVVTARFPIFGTGAGNFGVALHGMEVEQGKRGSYHGTHNTYTQVSSELGIPGFLCFACSLIFCWRDIRSVIRAYKPLTDPHSRQVFHTAHTLWLILVAYLVVFMFEYIAYSPLYLVICALITAFSHRAMNDYRAAHQQQRMQSGMQPGNQAPAGLPYLPPPGMQRA